MRILVINIGSSSIRFAMFDLSGGNEQNVLSGKIDGIGTPRGTVKVRDLHSATVFDKCEIFADHRSALEFLPQLMAASDTRHFDAVGHRVVHGGVRYAKPEIITETVESSLKELVPLAPEHLPHELGAIASIRRIFPGITQVACFDTAFHRSLPPVAQTIALPRNEFTMDIVHYGFHGLSYEFITSQLRAANQLLPKTIVAHLGNGASMAAILDGVCIDTTMSFTPTSGLVMSTRSGDLDPSILTYLQNRNMAAADIGRMINQESGLLGISGLSGDLRIVLEKESTEPRAGLAVDVFCYRIIKFAGALAAALGGLDQFVFTGGIGENSPFVRRRVCRGLQFLGMEIDEKNNKAGSARISLTNSKTVVRVLKTDEELMIARHVYELLR